MVTQTAAPIAQRGGIVMMLLFWVLLMAVGTWWIHGGAGHFEAPGRINGEPVNFLLDTGATYVAISAALADELGLAPGRSAWFNTANGRVEGTLTELDEVSLGGLKVQNVQGSISPGMERDTVLLGMSFLNLLSIEIQAGEMVLSLPEQ